MTSIKVDRAVRDRLAGVALARGVTMGALLDGASRQLEKDLHWTEIEAAYTRLQHDDPASWLGYLGELARWDADVDTDPAAAQEWPEFNQGPFNA